MRNECKQNPGRFSSEFKTLPNGADLKAKVKCESEKQSETLETPKAKFKYTFSRCHGAYPESNHSCFRCGLYSSPGWSAQVTPALMSAVLVYPHIHKWLPVPTSQIPTPPRSALTCPHTHTRTHTCPHTLAPDSAQEADSDQANSGTGMYEVGGAGKPRRRALQQTRGSRSPSKCRGLGGSGPFTATVSPEPRNLNRGRREGRGVILFWLSAL